MLLWIYSDKCTETHAIRNCNDRDEALRMEKHAEPKPFTINYTGSSLEPPAIAYERLFPVESGHRHAAPAF